jgi:hypothetical protein
MYLSEPQRLPQGSSADPRARELEREAGAACAGVTVLKRLTRLSPVQQQLAAQRRVAIIPRIYELKRQVAAERRAGDPRWKGHERELREIVARAFGRDYAISDDEATELARAKCELARAKVGAWRVLSPAVVGARVARIPSTDEERVAQRIQEVVKTKPPAPVKKRSFSEVFWKKVDDRIDGALGGTKVSAAWRKRIKAAARAAIEKGASTGFGKVLEEAGVTGATKRAVEGVVKGLAEKPAL